MVNIEEKILKCSCGEECANSELVVKHTIETETIPKHDYNDLTPSSLIEYEDKQRIVYQCCCPKCNKILVKEKGILV